MTTASDLYSRWVSVCSATDGALEAWAIDRRSNLLEDHRGLDLAEVRGDLNRHLAGDYTVNARRVAQDSSILDSLSGQTSTIKPMDPKRIFDNSRNSQTN